MDTNGNTDTGANMNDNKHSSDSEGLGVYGNDNFTDSSGETNWELDPD